MGVIGWLPRSSEAMRAAELWSGCVAGALEKAEYQNRGICVGEYEDYFGMGQSRISYHMRKLKDAGLIREERRGKWSFYSLDEEAVRRLLDIARVQLSA